MSLIQTPRRKIAFVGHSFHLTKSRSHEFLVKIFEKKFDVDFYWDESWSGGKAVDLLAIRDLYDTFVFFQIIYKKEVMRVLKSKNVIIMPMYDAVLGKRKCYWKKYRRFKFFCFSKTNYRDVSAVNIKSIYKQYYPPAHTKDPNNNTKPVVYFWQRVNAINWHTIKPLLDPEQIEKVIINCSVDPEHKFIRPTNEDIKNYHIEFVDWFEKPEDYFRMLSDIDIFVAPRPYEGIGFSFLNAMARGKVIIAADCPTANEYLDGDIAYIYKLDEPRRLDLSHYREKAAHSHAQYKLKAEKMPEFEEQLLAFVERRYRWWDEIKMWFDRIPGKLI